MYYYYYYYYYYLGLSQVMPDAVKNLKYGLLTIYLRRGCCCREEY